MKRLATFLVSCLAPSAFWAANVAADPPAAEALFEEGVALSERGALPQACAKFEGSEALDVAVGTLLRLADCYERTRRLASAWSRFREAASLAQAQAMPERAHIASVRAEALRWKMARLTVNVPANVPAGYSLELNGTAVPPASWGTAVPVDAGTLTLEASAPGYLTSRRRVVVPSVDAARVQVNVLRLDAEPVVSSPPPRILRETMRRRESGVRPAATDDVPAQREAPEDRGYAARVLGTTFMVVGGAGLATSGVLAVLAARRNDHSLDYCGDNARFCTARGVELRHEARRLADAATVSAAASGGLLVSGFVVYATAPRGHAAERVSVTAVPEAATRGVTLQVRGAF
jgi:hypothetical protein